MSRHEIIQDRNCPPLSTLLSLLEKASKRNDEVEGGWRAPANSAIVSWRISHSDRQPESRDTGLASDYIFCQSHNAHITHNHQT